MLSILNQRCENNKNAVFPSKYELNLLLPVLKKEYLFLKISNSQSLQMYTETLFGTFKRIKVVILDLSRVKQINNHSPGNKTVL